MGKAKKLYLAMGMALVAMLVAACAAFAAVTFDSTTGTGFAGKGDVQLAFGWNNSQLQSRASGVTFTYNAQDTYSVDCYWETETGQGNTVPHDITIPKHTSVNASVAYDPRVRNQITGFNLKGFGATVIDGTVPVLGGACPGNNPGTITAVTPTGSTGGLYANYGTQSVLIWPPAAPVV